MKILVLKTSTLVIQVKQLNKENNGRLMVCE